MSPVRYILDTNVVEAQQRKNPQLLAKLASLSPDQVAATVVTAQEQFRGWIAQLTKQQPADRYVWAYAGLRRAMAYFARVNVLDFDNAAACQYETLRKTYPRLGSTDLRIAAIALTTGAVLVTRNRLHFEPIAGLRVEDWL